MAPPTCNLLRLVAHLRDPPEAAKAAFAPEFELQAFNVPADVMPEDEDQRKDVS
jgi:hypothetical protein